MKKMILPLILLMICLLTLPVMAVESRSKTVSSDLTFTNEVANCKVMVSAPGETIEITAELWCGSILVDSWDRSGVSMVSLRETCRVTKGKTYTLKTYGTVDGVSFTGRTVTGTC